MKLYKEKTINEIKRQYDFKLSKSLGQNFLKDINIIEKIVEGSLVGENDLVIEIGPGIGVLTRELALRSRKVIAIELDKKLIPILADTLEDFHNVEVLNQDILKANLSQIIENMRVSDTGIEGVKIIGNLPYYITTPIIMKILEEGVVADSITVMMQKEVAERIKSPPGRKDYGAISVAVQYYCQVHHITNVSKEVFIPKPKVDSAVLRLDIRKEKPVELLDEALFFKCIKAGFGQRRKTLLNSLNSLEGLEKDTIKKVLQKIDIDYQRRAETLSIEEFAKLSNEIRRERK